MSRIPVAESLHLHLRRNGRQQAGALVGALGISRPTLARAVAVAPEVVRIGRGRSTHYSLAGPVRGEWRWPLYRLDAQAQVHELGTLIALQHGEMLLDGAATPNALGRSPLLPGLFPDLPWWLNDLRPSGFLGRSYAHRMADTLRVPADLNSWNTEHALTALLHGGSSQAGDLILGEAALQQAVQAIARPPDAVLADARATAYPAMADQVLQGEAPGSSPGGEQPKFTATVLDGGNRRECIVKFSPETSTPAGRRWADLLRCEAHAARVLQAHGIHAAVPELIETGNRVYLESPRFDRTTEGGRTGFVSLASLEAAFRGEGPAPWWQLSTWLDDTGWLIPENATDLSRLWWFGALIANTDMHLGNAALVLADAAPLRLAPAWDMLPMRLRPDAQGNLPPRSFQAAAPAAGQHAHWRWAAEAADDFWNRVGSDHAIDDSVHRFAREAVAGLQAARTHFA